MPRKFSTKKLTDLPLTSGYFNNQPHGPTLGYVQEPAVTYIKNERAKLNQDKLDADLFERLAKESNP
jgi:hypothetical protein